MPALWRSTAVVAPRLAPTVVWSTALYAMYTYLGDGLTSFGYSAEEIAEVILFYGCGAIIGVLIGGRMTDRLRAQSRRARSASPVSACVFCCCGSRSMPGCSSTWPSGSYPQWRSFSFQLSKSDLPTSFLPAARPSWLGTTALSFLGFRSVR